MLELTVMNSFMLLYFVLLLSNLLLHHPLTISLNLIFSSVFVAIYLWQVVTSWVAYAVVLIFLGGVMILFIYMTVMSNEDKLFMSKSNYMVLLSSLLLLIFYHSTFSTSYGTQAVSLTVLFSELGFGLLILITFFLIITLLVVVKVSESFKGSLLKKF